MCQKRFISRNFSLIFGVPLALLVLALPAPAAGQEQQRAVEPQPSPNAAISPAATDAEGFLVHTVESPYQRLPTTIRVLLPEGYAKGKVYPVVYVLPVEAGSEHRYGDGLLEVKRQQLHRGHRAIFVAPSFADLPWYADHPTKADLQQEQYFTRVVVPFVEQTYPALHGAEGRLLLGFSKSGWGAWTLLLRHPDRFGRAAAWDAPLMLAKPGPYGSGEIFGTPENFAKYRVANLLDKIDWHDRRRLILLGKGNFQPEHEQIRKFMTERRIPHTYREGELRKHDWHSGWVSEAVELLLQQ